MLRFVQCTHCEYHDPSEGSHFHPSTKEKQQNLNIEIQDFILIFFRYSATWRFCAQFCITACVLIANIIFAVKMLNLNIVAEATCLSRSPGKACRFGYDIQIELNLFRSSLVNLRCRSYLPFSKSEELLDLLISGHFMFRSS